MAGKGRVPKAPEQRRTRHAPQRGDWQRAPAIGWQHGRIPAAPVGLTVATRAAWRTWFGAWYASHWQPEDVPALRVLARLYDQVDRGQFTRATELRFWMRDWGLSPAGQQDRRWLAPARPNAGEKTSAADPYGYLRVVHEDSAG